MSDKLTPRELIAALKNASTADERYALIETAQANGMTADEIVTAIAAWL